MFSLRESSQANMPSDSSFARMHLRIPLLEPDTRCLPPSPASDRITHSPDACGSGSRVEGRNHLRHHIIVSPSPYDDRGCGKRRQMFSQSSPEERGTRHEEQSSRKGKMRGRMEERLIVRCIARLSSHTRFPRLSPSRGLTHASHPPDERR